MAKIAFIGLGHMGGGMAPNLAKAGHEVAAFDLSEEALARAVEQGCKRAGSTAEAVGDADVVVTMLPAAQHVLGVYRDQVFGKAPKTALLIDCSTIDVASARTVEEEAAAQGYTMVDAPVSGGSARAADGTLSIICGGEQADIEGWMPAFEAMSANVFHVGGIGQGLAMKLVNNMLIQTQTVALAEAFVMGAKAGLDPKVMYEVVRVSTGASFAADMRVPRMISGDFSPGGTVDISYKDQELETAFGKALGVPLFMANVSQQVYQMARAKGLNKEDGASVVKLYEEMCGVKLGPR